MLYKLLFIALSFIGLHATEPHPNQLGYENLVRKTSEALLATSAGDSDKLNDSWKKVDQLLHGFQEGGDGKPSVGAPANNIQRPVMEAIARLNKYYRKGDTPLIPTNATPNLLAHLSALKAIEEMVGKDYKEESSGPLVAVDNLYDKDTGILNRAYHAITQRSTSPHAMNPEEQIKAYLGESRILQANSPPKRTEIRKAMEKGIKAYLGAHKNKWPGRDIFKVAEQFYWNLQNTLSPKVISNLFLYPERLNWKSFQEFCEPYSVDVDAYNKPYRMAQLLAVYQAIPTDGSERAAFIKFYEPYLVGVDAYNKPYRMAKLLPVYQAFPTDGSERAAFIKFCEPYLVGVDAYDKPYRMAKLLLVYQAFPTDGSERAAFIKFCELYLVDVNAYDKPFCMTKLLPIFQAFPTDGVERAAFIKFCELYLVDVARKPSCMTELLPIYQAFPTDGVERAAFIKFCEPYLVDVNAYDKPSCMTKLLPIFQNPTLKQDFEAFMRSDLRRNPGQIGMIATSYLPRTYLRYMRVDAALRAENATQAIEARVQAMYETASFNQLPVLYGEDPHLVQARGIAGTANAHDFEQIYPEEYKILDAWCEKYGYVEKASSTKYTIYNNQNVKKVDYSTNEEVEDFIAYLDHEFAEDPTETMSVWISKTEKRTLTHLEIVSLIKQILGLEKKKGSTTGTFAPYLSSSMYYGKGEEKPHGDDLLGRVWFFIKKLGEGKTAADAADYKRSVVLSILEAAEISTSGANTHCQTRVTGELLKAISYGLEGSILKKFVVFDDTAFRSLEVKTQIDGAPLLAQTLFSRIHKEDTGAIRQLRDYYEAQNEENESLDDDCEPELWEIYEAYYDDLYRRTPTYKTDPTTGHRIFDGYKEDEHILMRDERGNLVSFFNADGALRLNVQGQPEPQLVYPQAVFQVLEQTFTELMRLEFEEQRGLKY